MCVRPGLLYGFESIQLEKSDLSKLEGYQRRVLRQIQHLPKRVALVRFILGRFILSKLEGYQRRVLRQIQHLPKRVALVRFVLGRAYRGLTDGFLLLRNFSVGKRTAQKDTIIDITSDSQVNSNFPYRWSPASLTFNNYFYLFLYLYITLIIINNNAPHLKSPKNQNRRAALGRPAIKITGGLQLVCGRPTLALNRYVLSTFPFDVLDKLGVLIRPVPEISLLI